LKESLALRKEIGENLGYFATLLRWAELHILQGDLASTRKFAQEGLVMAKTENVNFGVIRFLQILGRIALQEGSIEEAKACHNEALAYSEKYDFKSIVYEQHEALAELYEKEGNFKEALKFFRQFHAAKEYLINFQSSARLQSTQFINQIENARKEAEMEKEKHMALNEAYKIISEKQKEIIDSIRYAKRIQQSLLTSEMSIERLLKRLNKQG